MDNKNRRRTKRRKTVIKPPKKKNTQHLSRDEVRSINKKKLARKRKIQKHIFSILLGFVVLCVGMILVFSLFFKINVITVNGENIYSDKMVAEKSGVETGTNLFRVSEEKISAKLTEELPYIKGATIERKLPDTLVINVVSTKETAAISHNGAFVLIDETGKVLDKDASILRENVAVITNVKPGEIKEGTTISLSDEKKTEVLLKLLTAINDSELDLLTEINLKNVNDIKIKYDDRIIFEVGSLTNIGTKLSRGKAALEKENEINAYSEGTLDLKTEPYVYFKAGAEETTKQKTTKKQQK